jgi:hypothetical protein
MLKTVGYLISTLSVALLTLVAWQTVAHNSFLRTCLLIGAATSIIGMLCRWYSYRLDEGAASERTPNLGHARVDPRG